MGHCINIKHPEYQQLLKDSVLSPTILNAKIGVWQEQNSLEKFPTLEELKITAKPLAFNQKVEAEQITSNNQFIPSDYSVSEKTVVNLSNKLSTLLGIEVRIINDSSQRFKGKLQNKVAFINLAYATEDTPIHEVLGHPFVEHLKNNDKILYNKLMREISTTTALKHTQLLQQKFATAGIDVKVIEDTSLNTIAGEYLPLDSEEYKDLVKSGQVIAGQFVLKINPNNLFKDTITHEFSHLFIDLLGNYGNIYIRRAIKELKGTALWKEVAEAYSKLNERALGIEVLATAMGKNSANLLESTEKTKTLKYYIQKILSKIAKLFGISVDNVRLLSKMMLNAEINKETYQSFGQTFQQKTAKSIVDNIRMESFKTQYNPKDGKFYRFIGENLSAALKKMDFSDTTLWKTTIQLDYTVQPTTANFMNIALGYFGYEKNTDINTLKPSQIVELDIKVEELKIQHANIQKTSSSVKGIILRVLNGQNPKITEKNQEIIDFAKTLKASKTGTYISPVHLYDAETNQVIPIDLIKVGKDGSIVIREIVVSSKKGKIVMGLSIAENIFMENIVKKVEAAKIILEKQGYNNIFTNLVGFIAKKSVVHKINKKQYNPETKKYSVGKQTLVLNPLSFKAYPAIVNQLYKDFKFINPIRQYPELKEAINRVKSVLSNIVQSIKNKKNMYNLANTLQVVVNSLETNITKSAILSFVYTVNTRLEQIQKQLKFNLSAMELRDTLIQLEALAAFDEFSETEVFINTDMVENGKLKLNENTEIDLAAIGKLRRDLLAVIKGKITTLVAEDLANSSDFFKKKLVLEYIQKFRYENTKNIRFGVWKKNKFYLKGNAVSREEYNNAELEYTTEKLNELGPEVQAYAIKAAEEYIKRMGFDLDSFYTVLDPGMVSNELIRYALKKFDHADRLSREEMQNLEKEVAPNAKIFFSKNSENVVLADTKRIFKDIYAKNSKGEILEYFISKYNPEFHIKYRELSDLGNKAATIAFLKKNTVYDIDGNLVPSNKWLDKNYDKAMEDPFLKQLMSIYKNTETNILSDSSHLIKTIDGVFAEFYLAPMLNKSMVDRLLDNNKQSVFGKIKSNIKEGVKRNVEDVDMYGGTEQQVHTNKKLYIEVLLDSINNEQKKIPIYYHHYLSGKETYAERRKEHLQNLNFNAFEAIMANHYMALNYQTKSDIEIDIDLLKIVTSFQSTKVLKRQGWKGVIGKNRTEQSVETKTFSDSYTDKMLSSTIDRRLYGINKHSQELFGLDVNKITNMLVGYTARLGMDLNVPAAATNYLNGKWQTLMEGLTGAHFSREDITWSGNILRMAMLDGSLLEDFNSLVVQSKVGLVSEYLDFTHNFVGQTDKLSKVMSNSLKRSMRASNLQILQSGGEFMMVNGVGLAVLRNIKIKNKNGEFLDKNGEKTTFDKAMNLWDAMDRKAIVKRNGKTITVEEILSGDTVIKSYHIVINPIAKYTTLNAEQIGPKTITDIQMKIKRINWDLLPRQLRKRFGSAGHHGITTNLDELPEEFIVRKENLEIEEGYYISTSRFFYTLFSTIHKERSLLNMSDNVKNQWGEISDAEKHNINRFTAEFLQYMALAAMLTILRKGFKACKKQKGKNCGLWIKPLLIAKRLESEITVFHPYWGGAPSESYKLLKAPTATMFAIGAMQKFIYYIWQPDLEWERYKKGRRKGQFKFIKRAEDLIPGINQLNRDWETSYEYLNNKRLSY
jgi:hypothetical protein